MIQCTNVTCGFHGASFPRNNFDPLLPQLRAFFFHIFPSLFLQLKMVAPETKFKICRAINLTIGPLIGFLPLAFIMYGLSDRRHLVDDFDELRRKPPHEVHTAIGMLSTIFALGVIAQLMFLIANIFLLRRLIIAAFFVWFAVLMFCVACLFLPIPKVYYIGFKFAILLQVFPLEVVGKYLKEMEGK